MTTYRQTTCETCLAHSLLLLLNVEPNQEREMEILTHGLKFTKWNFSIGHLDFVARKYRKNISVHVEDIRLANLFKRLPVSKRITVFQSEIDLDLIKKLIKSPLILYVNDYLFRKEFHYPHFIVVWKFDKNRFVVTDPWDGKIKRLTPNSLTQGIELLKNTLKFSPQIIQLDDF